MKSIAYIEIDTHAEVAQDFIEIMQDSAEFNVDYYFSKRIIDEIGHPEGNIFLSESSMILDQLKSKRYDLIVIGTVHRYFNTFLTIAEEYNTAIIVHNINFIQSSKWRLLKNIFKTDTVYRLKLWWKEGLFYSSKVYQKAKNLMVLDEELSSGRFKFLPLFYTRDYTKQDHKGFTIVIPGGVSQKRRDYQRVISVIKKLQNSPDIQKKPMEFIFLGKAKNNELKQLIDLERTLKYINITYFKERVSQADFSNWMQKADVLWCPIQEETEFFSQKEIYGKTKMTGNIGDAIKFGKMAVFPKNYQSKLGFIISDQNDMIRLFEELKNNQFDFQKDYNKKTVKEKLETLLKSLIST
ncbi:hypothetical protein [Chryseobacterium taichungense]|uniref:hypothetical protein n=1 Tax=Chryseobacterium taichungense TaxID=295069 RepID=UPI0028AB5DBD|nr:hypothetical protein [Chryseobacterium taichungense]